MATWSSQDLSKALGVAINASGNANEVHFDSREIKNGDIFVALKSNNSDGHHYIDAALANGASYVLVNIDSARKNDPRLIRVPDTYQALLCLAEYNRKRSKAKYIAITGSVGKTSLKELLKLALLQSGLTYASRKSFNNYLGVPLTLASIPPKTQFAVIEIGINHANELTPLTKLVKPDLAIITAIAPAHMEFFTDLYALAKAKLEILAGLSLNGSILLPRDSDYYDFLAQQATTEVSNIYSFGWHSDADSRITDYQVTNNWCALKLQVFGTKLALETELVGQHHATNLSAAMLAVSLLTSNYDKALYGLKTAKPVKGRGNCLSVIRMGKELHILDDTYNANPASTKAALINFKNIAANRKIIILADMLELGVKAVEYHRDLAPFVIDSGAGLVLTLGATMQHLHDVLPPKKIHYNSIAELQGDILSLLKDGDWILLKGSNSMQLTKIVQYLSNKDQ